MDSKADKWHLIALKTFKLGTKRPFNPTFLGTSWFYSFLYYKNLKKADIQLSNFGTSDPYLIWCTGSIFTPISLPIRRYTLTFSSYTNTLQPSVSQQSLKHWSCDISSTSAMNLAPILIDSSVLMILLEWMSNRSANRTKKHN